MNRNIEIRANAIYPILHEGHPENKIRNAQFHAYCKGATEQKVIDDNECMTMVDAAVKEAKQVFLDKACEWLKAYDITFTETPSMLEDFRKAMEK